MSAQEEITMMPNARFYNKDPMYLRYLIDKAGITQRKAALLVGVPERTMRDYLNPKKTKSIAPYSVQFCLQCLSKSSKTHYKYE